VAATTANGFFFALFQPVRPAPPLPALALGAFGAARPEKIGVSHPSARAMAPME
jgi:hypothetical protein